MFAVRPPGRRAFTPDELAMLAGFANQACIAIELADARAQQQLVALFNDRDRIAADLHDHVIKQLFGTGLTLQGIAANVGSDHARRIRDTIGTLDTTIGQIRASIFALTATTTAPGPPCRVRILDVVAEHTPALGSTPSVRFSGPLDTLADDLVDDLISVLNGTLAALAQHPEHRVIDIAVTADERITLEITDPYDPCGCAPDPTAVDTGMRARRRARRHVHPYPTTPCGHRPVLDGAQPPVSGRRRYACCGTAAPRRPCRGGRRPAGRRSDRRCRDGGDHPPPRRSTVPRSPSTRM